MKSHHKNQKYKNHEKEEIINRVLFGCKSILSVSVNEGLLSAGILNDWIK